MLFVRRFSFLWTSKYFILFEMILLLNLLHLLSKSLLLTKLASFNFAAKFSAVNLLNSYVEIYFAWSGIKVVASGIFFNKWFTFVYSVLNFVCLATSLSSASFNFFKSRETFFSLPTSKWFTFLKKLLKLVGSLTSLLMFNFPSSAFKAIRCINACSMV